MLWRLKKDECIFWVRSEEHTSELQSQSNLVCRLLLEKKNHGNELSSSAPLRVSWGPHSRIITHPSIVDTIPIPFSTSSPTADVLPPLTLSPRVPLPT